MAAAASLAVPEARGRRGSRRTADGLLDACDSIQLDASGEPILARYLRRYRMLSPCLRSVRQWRWNLDPGSSEGDVTCAQLHPLFCQSVIIFHVQSYSVRRRGSARSWSLHPERHILGRAVGGASIPYSSEDQADLEAQRSSFGHTFQKIAPS